MKRRNLLLALAAGLAVPGSALARGGEGAALYALWLRDAQRWYTGAVAVWDAYETYLAQTASGAVRQAGAETARAWTTARRADFQQVAAKAEILAAAPPPPTIGEQTVYTQWSVTVAGELSTIRRMLVTAIRRPGAEQPALLTAVEQAGDGDAAAGAGLARGAVAPLLRGARLYAGICDVMNVAHQAGSPGGLADLTTMQHYAEACAAGLQAVTDAADGKPVDRKALAKSIRGRVRALQQGGTQEHRLPGYGAGVAAIARFAATLDDAASTPEQWRAALWVPALILLDPNGAGREAQA